MTAEELALIARMVEHADCNCGENECFTPDEIETATYAITHAPVRLIGRVRLSEKAAKVLDGVKL